MRTFTRRSFLESSAGSVAAIGLGAASVRAQDRSTQAAGRHEWISVKHGGRSVESVIAYPESKAKAPGMVVIHEIFGMTDWVERVTDEFAQAGYIAIAPDLLSGMAPNGGRTKDFPAAPPPAANGPGPRSFGPAGEAIVKLPPDQVTADLNAVADYIKSLSDCNGKVCVVGFSWGGGQSFRFATNRQDLAASFVFYGSGPAPGAIAAIQAPVYGFYAGSDARINGTLPATQEEMKAAGKLFDPVTYEGATHGFMRSGESPGASDADKRAREASWGRIRALTEKLK